MSITGQYLLKRKAGMPKEEFKKYYIEHHGPLALPYFLGMGGLLYYAQVCAPRTRSTLDNTDVMQYHNIRWASPEAQSKYPDIDLTEWDAVAESAWESKPQDAGSGVGGEVQKYYDNVLLPDERRFLFSEALKHYKELAPGSVTGERTVLVEDGKVLVEYEFAKEAWEKCMASGAE